jgi:hypothetical protein
MAKVKYEGGALVAPGVEKDDTFDVVGWGVLHHPKGRLDGPVVTKVSADGQVEIVSVYAVKTDGTPRVGRIVMSGDEFQRYIAYLSLVRDAALEQKLIDSNFESDADPDRKRFPAKPRKKGEGAAGKKKAAA